MCVGAIPQSFDFMARREDFGSNFVAQFFQLTSLGAAASRQFSNVFCYVPEDEMTDFVRDCESTTRPGPSFAVVLDD